MPQILYPPQEDNNDKDDQARAQRELLPSALILCPMWMCPHAHPWVLKLKCFNLSGKKKKNLLPIIKARYVTMQIKRFLTNKRFMLFGYFRYIFNTSPGTLAHYAGCSLELPGKF